MYCIRRVPDENLLGGKPGMGFKIAMTTLDGGTVYYLFSPLFLRTIVEYASTYVVATDCLLLGCVYFALLR